jgi:hypothetical protein
MPPTMMVPLVAALRYFVAVTVLACPPSVEGTSEEAACGEAGGATAPADPPPPPPDQALNDSRLSDTVAVAWSFLHRASLLHPLRSADGDRHPLAGAAREVLGARLALAAPDALATWSILRGLPRGVIANDRPLRALLQLTCAWRSGTWPTVRSTWRILAHAGVSGDAATVTWLCLLHRLLPTMRHGIFADVAAAVPARLTLPLCALAAFLHPRQTGAPAGDVHGYWAARTALQCGGSVSPDGCHAATAMQLQQWRRGMGGAGPVVSPVAPEWRSWQVRLAAPTPAPSASPLAPAVSDGCTAAELKLAAAMTPLRDDPALAVALCGSEGATLSAVAVTAALHRRLLGHAAHAFAADAAGPP